MFRHKLLFSPDGIGSGSAPVEDNELSKEGMIDFLADEDKDEIINLDTKTPPPPPASPRKEEKEEVDEEDDEEVKEEVDELKEIEEELDGPSDDKLELVTPVRRKEILAAYPDLFKKFPYLENAYYREQQFTELLPTIDDAREAVSKAEVLDKFDADLSSGNLDNALKAVKQHGEDAFNTLVDNYLPNLAKVDKDAYHHVIGNIIRTTTIQMLQEAKSSGNEDLQEAARILNSFVFGTQKILQPSNLSKTDPDEKKKVDEVKQREEQFIRRQFETARDDVSNRVTNSLKATIEANIDPKGSMSPYVKKHAAREAQEKVISLLESDKRLQVIIDKLWNQSAKQNFNKSSLDQIRSTWNSRAKTLLPTVLKQARIEALKSSGRRIVGEKEDEGPLPVGRSTSSSNSARSEPKSKGVPEGMSTKDFLMQD